ncbi:MAG: pyruvoyl-dependent arginine decarboxylase [archaeon GB-1867-005]|nr:pyruvoyl-dependent arginine decarboxylase [Candidatus Culexmicrobium cathedralense]
MLFNALKVEVDWKLMPTRYFVTSGKAVSNVSPLNAFDRALMEARIAQCNLVPVTSILPKNAVEVDYEDILPGTVTFTVMARADGQLGEVIGAGVGIAKCADYGLIAEAYGSKSEVELREELMAKLKEMAEARGMEIDEIKVRVESMRVEAARYGCVVAAVILLI